MNFRQLNQRCSVVAAAALLLLAIAAHGVAVRNGFIWDDDDHLTQNAAVIAPGGLRAIWSALHVSRYYPLTLTTFWLEHRLWGLHPLPYHAVNIALHGVNAVVLYFLLRRLQVRAAWMAAALWAVHPVNVESVAWVTELKNTQSAFFFFLTLLCYLRFERQPKPGWFAAALACFAAALLSKPSTVMLPAVLLLCAWWQRQRWTRADFCRAAPFFVLTLGMSLLTIAEQQLNIRGHPEHWSLSLAQRLVIAGRDLWFYGVKLFWPRPLVFVYPRWPTSTIALGAWWPLAGVLLAGLALWVGRQTRSGRASLFGLGYFALSLAPVLGFLDVYYFRYSFVADHFQYLASVGPLALVAAAGAVLVPWPVGRAAIAGLAILGLSALTWQHSQVFRDNETLWRDTLAKNPTAVLAHNNLGNAYKARRQFAPAEAHLREALRLDPDSAAIHNNLGAVLAELGEYDAAAGQFLEAVRLKPDFADARHNLADASLELGRQLIGRGDSARAIETYRQALLVLPQHLHLANALAWALATCRDLAGRAPDEAIRLAERLVTQTNRRVPEPLDTLAAGYAAAGRFAEAVAVAREALALAETQASPSLAAAIQARLHGYEKRRPAS